MSEQISLDGISVAQARPVFDEVLVRPLSKETERPSGLVIPDRAAESAAGNTFHGVCVAVGPGALTSRGALIPPPCQPGDHVVCVTGFGPEVTFREGRHWLVQRSGQFGHGVILVYKAEHEHCWHMTEGEHYIASEKGGYSGSMATVECCGCEGTDFVETRLPSCRRVGPRVAVTHKNVEVQRIVPVEAAPMGAACLGDEEVS